MNNRISKKIRRIINPQDATTRRVYRRAKKQYVKTPKSLRKNFFLLLDDLMTPQNNN